MYLLFVVLMVLAAVLMCFVVLIQNSKGGGLSSSFASSNQIMGVRKTTDFIEKTDLGFGCFHGSNQCSYFLRSSFSGRRFFSNHGTGCKRAENKSVECSCRFCCSSED